MKDEGSDLTPQPPSPGGEGGRGGLWGRAFFPLSLWERGRGRGLFCLLPSAFCLLLLSCARVEEQPVGQAAQEVRGPDQEAWGWESKVTKGGVRRAVIRAGRFRHYGLSRVDSLDRGVEVVFFDASGRRTSVLRSPMGAVEQQDRRMLALGGVVVTAEDSTTLEADALRWDNERERIYGDGAVTIRRADGVETGVGFESTPDLKRWSMRNVTTKKTR